MSSLSILRYHPTGSGHRRLEARKVRDPGDCPSTRRRVFGRERIDSFPTLEIAAGSKSFADYRAIVTPPIRNSLVLVSVSMGDRRNHIPAVYRDGYERARAESPDGAANYVAHTRIGDPAADAVVEALAPFDQTQVHRFIQAGMERQEDVLREAPQTLGDFFERIFVPLPGSIRRHSCPVCGPITGIPTYSSPRTSPRCWSRGSRRPSASLFS